MEKIDREFPMYKWSVNKGYPTKDHRAAIAEHGTTPHHRMTFKLL
jgi:ribonuclease HII